MGAGGGCFCTEGTVFFLRGFTQTHNATVAQEKKRRAAEALQQRLQEQRRVLQRQQVHTHMHTIFML